MTNTDPEAQPRAMRAAPADTVAAFVRLILSGQIAPDSPRGRAYADSLSRNLAAVNRSASASARRADPAALAAATQTAAAVATCAAGPECYAMTGDAIQYRADAWAVLSAAATARRSLARPSADTRGGAA
jgi:hypothetical protein